MFFDHFCQIFVDVFHHLIFCKIPQGFLHQGLEGFLLASGGEGEHSSQDPVHKFRMGFLRIFGIIQRAVKVCTPVVKGREKKACVWRFHHPVPDSVVELIAVHMVA